MAKSDEYITVVTLGDDVTGLSAVLERWMAKFGPLPQKADFVITEVVVRPVVRVKLNLTLARFLKEKGVWVQELSKPVKGGRR